MNKNKIVLAIMLSGLVSTSVLATNGYFSHGYGAKEKGMAGAGVAKAGNSISSANNPALLIDVGDRMDVGFSIFNPVRSVNVSGEPSLPAGFSPVIGGIPSCAAPGMAPCQVPFSMQTGTTQSTREWFAIPAFGYSARIDETSVWGISVYGNGGMNSSYKGSDTRIPYARVLNPNTNSTVNSSGIFGGGNTGVDLSQLFINTTYAYKASESLDLGVSLIIGVQTFEAKGLGAFANISSEPTKLTDNGKDVATGLGFKIGGNLDLTDTMKLGASYQSEINMTEFKDYAGLFAQGGDFDVPATFTVGLAVDITPTSTFLLDYQGIYYSDVAAIANGISPITSGQCFDALNTFLFTGAPGNATGAGCLGSANGAGFGWDDMFVTKLGYEWAVGEDTMRIGYSTTTQPIPKSEVNFNLLAPGVIEEHFTAGYTMKHGENEWTFFIMYAPEVKVSGQSAFDPAQTISFKMHQLEFGVDFQF